MTIKGYLSLGSNMGDSKGYLQKAIEKLNESGLVITKKSSYYKTDPVGYTDQAVFLNQVIEFESTMDPISILNTCLSIELELDRVRKIRWGPRTIDIDILLLDDLIINTDRLTVPHPRMHERAFVVVPLYEINGLLDIKGIPIQKLYNKVSKKGVRKLIYEQ